MFTARVISPNALLELDAANVAGCRTAVHTIQPAIRSPGQMVGKGLCVLHAKTGEQDFRFLVGHVIPVSIWIKQKIGNLQDKHSAITKGQSGAKVQALDEV